MAVKTIRRLSAALFGTFALLIVSACQTKPEIPHFSFSGSTDPFSNAAAVSTEEIGAYEAKYSDAMSDHYKLLLSEKELYIYNAVSYAVDNGYSRIYFPEEYYCGGNELAINEIVTLYSCDSPFLEHNYADNGIFSLNVITPSGGFNSGKKTYFFDLPHIDEHSLTEKKSAYDKAVSIIKKLPSTKTDEEKALIIYDTVLQMLTFADEDEYDFSSTAVYEALCGTHSAVCDGYADTLMMLFNLADIPTFAVEGINGKNVGHVLDMAEINGEYYYFDVSADNSPKKLGFTPRFFCFLNDEYVSRDFTAAAYFEELVPKASENGLEYRADIVVAENDDKAEEAAKVLNKNGSVAVLFANDDTPEHANDFGAQMLEYTTGRIQVFIKNGISGYIIKKE